MTGQAIIAELKDLQPIEGADKIVQGTIFGETVIVSKDHEEGEIGILFDCETQLSHEFCHHNNLYRHTHLNEDPEKSGYIEDNRRVRAIKLRGVKCSGMWMPLDSLNWTDVGLDDPKKSVGTQFKEWGACKICDKYVNKRTRNAQQVKQGKAREELVPTFKEHIDTDQFARNLQHVVPGCTLIITEKLHGTSCRVGNMPVLQKPKWWQKLLGLKVLPKYGHVVGSRRVVKQAGEKEIEGNSFYDTDIWSLSAEQFRGKLEKGETVYYEIVGYLPNGQAIMSGHSNLKLKKFMEKDEYKAFIEKYGEVTDFSYNLRPTEHAVFVYRMTLTNEDGHTVDYTWDQVKMRCEQIGVDPVPELDRQYMHEWEGVRKKDGGVYRIPANHSGIPAEKIVEKLTEADSDIFTKHLREGVCVRIDGPSMTPKFFKHKAYLFKVLEGIIKDTDIVDLEEEQG